MPHGELQVNEYLLMSTSHVAHLNYFARARYTDRRVAASVR